MKEVLVRRSTLTVVSWMMIGHRQRVGL